MIELPNIPRLYTALAEVLAVCLYADRLPLRCGKTATGAITVVWVIVLGAFLKCTGFVPLMWWIPCMLCAVSLLNIYLWGTRCVNWLEALYTTARAFMLAELAASVEWQLHCVLWPQQRATAPLSVLLLAAVYTAVYGFLYWFERRHAAPTRLTITAAATLMAVVMAVTAFAVSNLSFISDNGVTMSVMSIFYIRTLVEAGDVERAALFLGHRHCLTQTVVHGHRLGRTLGIPTVNLTFPPHVLAPRRGVYITRVYLPDGTSLAGVTNVGTRPTVSDGTAVSVETFLLDFDGDLYGKCIRVEFCRRLRDEQKFDSLEALKAQIRENIRQTRDYFAAESTRG